MERQLRALFADRNHFIHLREVEFWIDTLAVHIHRHSDDVHISGPLTITKQRSLYAVSTCEQTKLPSRNRATAIVMRMQGHKKRVAMTYVVAEPLDLIGVDVRCADLHSRRQVDNHFVIGRWLDDINDCVTDINGKVHLGAREALWAIFENPFSF